MNYPLPTSNYKVLRRIIIAYSKYPEEIVTGAKISEHLSLSRKITASDVSKNSDFFCAIGLLEESKKRGDYIVTDACKRLGEALSEDDSKKVADAWSEVIRDNKFFRTLRQRIEAADNDFGSIKTSELKENIISLSRYKGTEKNKFHVRSDFSLAVIHIMEAARIINLPTTKTVKLHRSKFPNNFISIELIADFKKIKVKKFNLTRLIHYCTQINENYSQGYFEAVAFVTRALMDHVPPIFNQPNFESIGSSVRSGKVSSFKKSCDNLNNSLKHIVDDLIHKQISAGASVLVKEEIDFSQDINTFLRRVLEELKSIQSQES